MAERTLPKRLRLVNTDLHWVAALLEGEGWFGTKRYGLDVTIEVASVDKDVIDKVERILEYGQRSTRLLH